MIKNNKWIKALSVVGIAAIATFLFSDSALAQDSGISRVSGNLTEGLKSTVAVISIFAYIAGLAFGIKGGLKLKEYSEAKGQIPLSQPVTTLAVAAFLIALPSLLTVVAESLFGTDAVLLTKDDELTDIDG